MSPLALLALLVMFAMLTLLPMRAVLRMGSARSRLLARSSGATIVLATAILAAVRFWASIILSLAVSLRVPLSDALSRLARSLGRYRDLRGADRLYDND